jgi:hypothetical protein
MISYSTNWMGPVNKKWYEDRNLELWTYSAGRIDCRGGDLGVYGDEIGLPPMMNEDWDRFSNWLDTLKTDTMWSLPQLVEEYERTHPKITWANDEI